MGAGDPVKPGMIDHGGIAWGSYGGKVGVWRLIDLLSRTASAARSASMADAPSCFPKRWRQIVKSGHDVAGHGYVQDQLLAYIAPDEEQRTIRRCLDALEKATGQRPLGWLSPVDGFHRAHPHFLAEEKLLWHGDARDSDLPHMTDTSGGAIVHIPASDFTDNRMLRWNSMDLWDIYKETFDYLYQREAPAFLALSMHCHFGGRPMISAVLDKVFKHCCATLRCGSRPTPRSPNGSPPTSSSPTRVACYGRSAFPSTASGRVAERREVGWGPRATASKEERPHPALPEAGEIAGVKCQEVSGSSMEHHLSV